MMTSKHKTYEEFVDYVLERTRSTENKDFKEWLLSKKEFGILFDAHLYKFCYQIITNYINKNNDYMTIIVGDTGTGKSTLASKMCAIISPTFSMDDLCFDGEKVLINARDK